MSVRVPPEVARRLLAEAGEPLPAGVESRRVGPPVPFLPEGPPGRWLVEVPGFVPPSLNRCRRKHWSAEWRAKRKTADVLALPLRLAGVTLAAGRRRVGLAVTRRDGKHADEENIQKLLRDPLKWLGVIRDDGPRWLENGGYAVATGPDMTTLTIEDIG